MEMTKLRELLPLLKLKPPRQGPIGIKLVAQINRFSARQEMWLSSAQDVKARHDALAQEQEDRSLTKRMRRLEIELI